MADACRAVSYATDDLNTKIQAVVDIATMPRVFALMGTDEPSIIVPALSTVGNIVTGTVAQINSVKAAEDVPKLAQLLCHSKNNIVKEAAWTNKA